MRLKNGGKDVPTTALLVLALCWTMNVFPLSPAVAQVPDLSLLWPVDPDNRGALGNDYAHFNYVVKNEYHTGIDISAPIGTAVRAVADGWVVKIQENGGRVDRNVPCNPNPPPGQGSNCADHGYGSTVIIKHELGEGVIYTQYSHLNTINEHLKEACGPENTNVERRRICATPVRVGVEDVLGEVGCSRYGESICDTSFNPHLHFEVKDFPTLGTGGDTGGDDDGEFGYTPNHPDDYGYYDPVLNLHNVTDFMSPSRVRVSVNGLSLRVGPGGAGNTEYRVIRSLNAGEEYEAIANSGATTIPDCPGGWYQIRHGNGGRFADINRGGEIPDGWACSDFVSEIHSAQPCHRYVSGDPAPSPYGLAWNWFSSERELLLTARCAPDTTTITVGKNNDNLPPSGAGRVYTWGKVYAYDGVSWNIHTPVPVTCTRETTTVDDATPEDSLPDYWCNGTLEGSLPPSIRWFAGFTCI